MPTRQAPPSSPLHIPWRATALWVMSSGVTAAEIAHLADPYTFGPVVTGLSVIAAGAAGGLVGTAARTAGRRLSLKKELDEHLQPLLGWPEGSTKGMVTVTKWLPVDDSNKDACILRSYPAEIKMRYTSSIAARRLQSAAKLSTTMSRANTLDSLDADDDDAANADWYKQISMVLTDFIGLRYTISCNRRTRTLTAKPAAAEPIEPDNIRRLRVIISRQFESGAKIVHAKTNKNGDITTFTVRHSISDKLAQRPIRMHGIENMVSSVLPGRWRGNWKLVEDLVTFELRPTLPKLLFPRIYGEPATLQEAIANYPDTRFFYAEDEDRQPISWWPKKVPHRLIIGPTGSGKTSSIHTFITQAARCHWQVFVCDRKNVEFRGFRDWPNVACVATRIEDQIALIHRVWMIMKERYALGESGDANTEDFVPIMLVLDELTELLKDIDSYYSKLKQRFPKESKNWPKELPTEEEIGSILRLGRTARIHIIIGMQRPDVKYLAGENRDNLTGRQSLGSLGRHGADMLWGDYRTGTTIPATLLGRGIALNDAGSPVEVQHYFTPDPNKNEHLDIPLARQVLEDLRPTFTSHPRMVFDTPDPWTEFPDDENERNIYFLKVLEAKAYHAADYPDLDPLSDTYKHRPKTSGAGANAALGLTPDSGETVAGTLAVSTTSGRRKGTTTKRSRDRFKGFGSAAPRTIDELKVGDLILVDPAHDQWAVLEFEPDTDPIDEHLMVLHWRGDDDERDFLTVDPDDPVVSRPLLDEEDEQPEAA